MLGEGVALVTPRPLVLSGVGGATTTTFVESVWHEDVHVIQSHRSLLYAASIESQYDSFPE